VSSHADTIRTVLYQQVPSIAAHSRASTALDALLAEHQQLREALEVIAKGPSYGFAANTARAALAVVRVEER
jgi:hypothetical protein